MSATAPALSEQRTRLLWAIETISRTPIPTAAERIALAEAELRLAIQPDTNLDEAIDRLLRARSLDPYQPRIPFHLGRVLHRSGDFWGAVGSYRAVLTLAPASERAYAHLALALMRLDAPAGELGEAILDTLVRGDGPQLSEHLTAIDDLLTSNNSPAGRPATPPALPTRRVRQSSTRGTREVGASANCADTPSSGSPTSDFWRLLLIEQIARSGGTAKAAPSSLSTKVETTTDDATVAEYALARLLHVLKREQVSGEAASLMGDMLSVHPDNPAVRLLATAVEIIAASEPEQLVERASNALTKGFVPIELICSIHYARVGPNSGLPIAKALRLLDRYPPEVRREACFREMTLAILDGFARGAWAEGRWAHARLLWREATTLDPYRVALAHNLALLAARTRMVDEYSATWERAAELRYLNAAALGDVQAGLVDRLTMHKAMAQHSQQRSFSGHTTPNEQDLHAWLEDVGAVETWLSEWDRYYLNARLQFRSPVHLLGVPRDASDEAIAGARDSLLAMTDSALRSAGWAGVQAFSTLVEELVHKAFDRASDPIDRARDPDYEAERMEAEALTAEACQRVVTSLQLAQLLAKHPSPHQVLRAGALTRSIRALPLRVLQPMVADRIGLDHDADLVAIVENQLLNILFGSPWGELTTGTALEWLIPLDTCIAVVPHRIEPRFLRCRCLLQLDRSDDAYRCALEALPLLDQVPDNESGRDLEENLFAILDTCAARELPKAAPPTTAEEQQRHLDELLTAATHLLARFPRASGLRIQLADIVMRIGGPAELERILQLLEEGEQAEPHERRRAELIAKCSEVQEEQRRVRVTALLESAARRVEMAIQDVGRLRTRAVLDQARLAVDTGLAEAEQARDLAASGRVPTMSEAAEALIAQIHGVQTRLREG
jgi:tetratricopeptide (TPR) repeat protein